MSYYHKIFLLRASYKILLYFSVYRLFGGPPLVTPPLVALDCVVFAPEVLASFGGGFDFPGRGSLVLSLRAPAEIILASGMAPPTARLPNGARPL